MSNEVKVGDQLVELSKSQTEGLVRLSEWYEDKKKLIFTLHGAAGTGKTTLTRKFIKDCVKQPLCVTAPTHKATRVIETITGRKGKTLQSLHGLRPNFNFEKFDINNIRFETMGNIYMANYKLVIIDECSQINKELQELNEVRSEQFNTKILYVGDKFQLPPVKQRESGTFKIEDQFELMEIVRQKENNPLINLLTTLRKDMTHNRANFLRILKESKSVFNKEEGYELVNIEKFQKLIISSFQSDEFKENVDFCRYAAWTNASVLKWNTFIRGILFKSDNLIEPSDLLTGYRTIVDEYNTPIIVNSEDYRVKDVELTSTDYGFDVYKAIIVNINDFSENLISIVNHKDPKSMASFYKEVYTRYEDAIYAVPNERGKKWREYYRFKDRYLILTTFPLHDSDDSNRILNWVPKDIDYGYGLTIHKLQGSTIKNIYINLNDIYYYNTYPQKLITNTSRNPYAIETRNKLVYTGLSRASHKAILFI